jgi:hypothetical protein
MTEHDEIILRLTDDVLIGLLKRFYPQIDKNAWGNKLLHTLCKNPCDNWRMEWIRDLLDCSKMEGVSEDDSTHSKRFDHLSFKEIQLDLLAIKLAALHAEPGFIIDRKFEFALVKGDGMYKTTKGFADLIVHVVPYGWHLDFKSFSRDLEEFFIEVKTEKDFKDFGQILRQINEYREFYDNGCTRWTSKFSDDYYREHNWIRRLKPKCTYCVLSTKIPDNIKALFEREGIACLEIGE